MANGLLKTEAVATALAEYLIKRGVDPFKDYKEELRSQIFEKASSRDNKKNDA